MYKYNNIGTQSFYPAINNILFQGKAFENAVYTMAAVLSGPNITDQ